MRVVPQKAYFLAEIKRKEGNKIQHTKIEWALNPDGTPGYTWNPITGCLNHIDGMCKGGNFPCWAYGLAHGRLKSGYLANENIAIPCEAIGESRLIQAEYDPFYPRFWEDRLVELEPTTKRNSALTGCSGLIYGKGIFVCDMSDLFGIGVPENWTRTILRLCQKNHKHRFYLLTKQPQNLVKFSPFPDNVYLGVTATSYDMFLRACTALEYPQMAKVKYLSIEPLLNWENNWTQSYMVNALERARINQVIIGSQTKPTVYPKIEWVREIVEACDKAGILVFLKNNLKPLADKNPTLFYTVPFRDGDNREVTFEPIKLQIRQEMPK